MKIPVTGYKIYPSSKYIELGENGSGGNFTSNTFYKILNQDPFGTYNFDLKRLLTIINQSTNEVIYSQVDSTLGGTAASGGVTLTKNITSYSGTESLQIWYDSPLNLPSQMLYWMSGVLSMSASSSLTSPTATLDNNLYYFVFKNYDVNSSIKFSIDEIYNGAWRPTYEIQIPNNAASGGSSPSYVTTPIIQFINTKMRYRFNVQGTVTSGFQVYAIPVAAGASSAPISRPIQRMYAASGSQGSFETFGFGSACTPIEVPPQTTKVKLQVNMAATGGSYIDKSITISASNQKIDFIAESTAFNVTVATSTYTPTTLATAIQTALSSSSTALKVAYNSITKLFSFYTTGGSPFTLLFATGANNANTIANTIGFQKADVYGSRGYASAQAPMVNYTQVWLEGSNDWSNSSITTSSWEKLYTPFIDTMTYPLNTTSLSRYTSSGMVPAATAIQTNSNNYIANYMEVPILGYRWIRINSSMGGNGTDYSGSDFVNGFGNIKLILGEFTC